MFLKYDQYFQNFILIFKIKTGLDQQSLGIFSFL